MLDRVGFDIDAHVPRIVDEPCAAQLLELRNPSESVRISARCPASRCW
jgi:hypothetical protein